MKTGMIAAEAVATALANDSGPLLVAYPEALKKSWVWDELHRVRNIRPAFRWGMWAGLLYAGLDTYLFRGKAPWTLRHHADHDALLPALNPSPSSTGV